MHRAKGDRLVHASLLSVCDNGSVATAWVFSDLLNKAFSVHRSVRIYCSHRNSAAVHIQDVNLMYM